MRMAETRLNKLKNETSSLDAIATPLITAINDRDFWPKILDELNARLPSADIWVTELGATAGGKLLEAGEKRTAKTATVSPTAIPSRAAGQGKMPQSRLAIDGILVRGLYMYNPKQQELVVDYFRSLAQSALFVIDEKKPERVIKSSAVPNDREWAFSYELDLTLRNPVILP